MRWHVFASAVALCFQLFAAQGSSISADVSNSVLPPLAHGRDLQTNSTAPAPSSGASGTTPAAPKSPKKPTPAPTPASRMEPLQLDHASVQATTFVGITLAALLLVLWWGWKTPETVTFFTMVLLWDLGIISSKAVLGSFGNSGLLSVGALFVVVKGVERSQVVVRLSKQVFGLETGLRSGLLRMMIFVFLCSSVLNNTPLVALFIPIVRDWTRSRGYSNSWFLIPMCYAVVLGGKITIIGTSTDLVINGLIADQGLEQIGFFEFGRIGLPVGLVCILYMWIVAPWILKGRGSGLFRYIRDKADELITEVQISKEFPHVNQSVAFVVSKLGLGPDSVLKIRRPNSSVTSAETISPIHATGKSSSFWNKNQKEAIGVPSKAAKDTAGLAPAPSAGGAANYTDIFPVDVATQVKAGDTLFIIGEGKQLVAFQGDIILGKTPGLKFLDVQASHLPSEGTEFFEVVLSDHNQFVGLSQPTSNKEFSAAFGCNVLAVRQIGVSDIQDVDKTDDVEVQKKFHSVAASLEVQRRPFQAGDLVLVLASKDFDTKWKDSHEFYLISKTGNMPKPVTAYDYVALIIFFGMLGWVASDQSSMTRAAFTVGAIYILGGWVKPKEAIAAIDWPLLLLISSALGVAQAITSSGMADYIANAIKDSGVSNLTSVLLHWLFCYGVTQIVTNNAAGALVTPVAITTAKVLGVSYKPFVAAVMSAASSNWLTPIGYQCNTMVWAPGNYSFTDFTKIGIPLTLIQLLLTIFLIPHFFPFGAEVY